jgi:glucose/arabinose dehydrogenase
MDFSEVRNIIKIGKFDNVHIAGALQFDSLGKLYLSVGDGSQNDVYEDHPQDLNDYRGKILRLDTSELLLKPEIIAYGIRNAWGVTIDSQDRMFILQCGFNSVEGVSLVDDLYSGTPSNLGWPVFEGSQRKRKDPLMFNDVLAPIFETTVRPGCMTAGVYLDDLDSFLFADFYGTIRLLKQKESGDWYLFHKYKHEESIWGFGLDTKTKKIFITPGNLELEILFDQVNLN